MSNLSGEEEKAPFPKKSIYKQAFLNWGPGKINIEKAPPERKLNMKFRGKSHYKDTIERTCKQLQ